ncbi:MAG: acyl-[ACP]--phospholipid O-acyltransferase [Nitrospira sp.]|nr:MFS transporter [Candidatus Manganitrophaceae bacterium]HIL35828.1 MFS transporter [Candidatus Manganitrophaceae bacterium]
MATGKYKDLLKSLSFQSFLWTQFLGAFNDNVCKIVVSMVAVNLAVSSGGGSGDLPLVGAIFILPFFLFSGYAGHLADVYSKRTVLVITKCFEIVSMGLALLAFLSGRIEWMLGVLFLMALQSTFFSPAKYGILPEIIPDNNLSRANGLLEMSTFLAIILGTSIGSMMFAAWKDRLWLISLFLISIAVVGSWVSFGIYKVPPSGIQKPFPLNPWGEIAKGIKRIYREKVLWHTVLAISYFWFLGALLQMSIILFGKEVLVLDDFWVGILGTFLAFGIGVGSLVAGRLSGDKVELGLVPLGSIGLGLFSIWLGLSPPSYFQAAMALSLLGFSGGLFIVPLNALIQQKSGREEKGRIIATTNFMDTGGILLASAALWIFRDLLQVQADRIIIVFGFFTLLVTVYILSVLPDFLIRFVLWLLTHTIYRIRIRGQEHVPFRGPALLVCNHVSFVDGLLVGACVQRFIRFLVFSGFFEIKGVGWFLRKMKAIPISVGNRRGVVQSIERARESLKQGHVVCIFAEGAISRTGNMLSFKRGFERMGKDLNVPIIPVHLDGLWGSIFSFEKGRFFFKWPRQIPYPVTISFGLPLPANATAQTVRQAVMELGSEAVKFRRAKDDLLHFKFIRSAKSAWKRGCMSDSTGKRLTYGKALIGAFLLSRRIRRKCRKEEMVGLMLPSSVGGALANIATLLAGKVPVNLNFTAGKEAIDSAVQQCGIKAVLTSRVFVAKANLEHREEFIYLEDLLKKMKPAEKIVQAILLYLLPGRLIQKIYCPEKSDPNHLATVIFSSGSTGDPKGVMLSHHNVLSNVESLAQLFWVTRKDTMMGVLPFFHSFGFTGTLWFPLLYGFGAIYHPNPMEAKKVGALVLRHKATILISTPTFYKSYIRRCSKEEFSSLRYAMVGAEKLRKEVALAFREKYDLSLLEGYGCTELAPVVCVNVEDVHHGPEFQKDSIPETVGHPVPGVALKVVDPDTGEVRPVGQEGLLFVKGPNLMMGYLNQPEKTAEVIQGDWYNTGDIAAVDGDGFVRITDRLSRFSKIGGEMVPHIKIEEVVSGILGTEECAVCAVPDEQKGERIVCFYVKPEMTPEALWGQLKEQNLPKLWLPKRENLYPVEALPVLGTGKRDLRALKAMALEVVAAQE